MSEPEQKYIDTPTISFLNEEWYIQEMKDDCNDCKPFTPLGKRLHSFCTQREKYQIEWSMIKYSLLSIFLLIIFAEILAFTIWKTNLTYLTQLPWVIYLIITISVVFSAVNHIQVHKTTVSSMMGMVIGMILGMQSGVMLSVIIGSTNGMFMGSLFGLLFGITIGVYAGRSSGLMGILNGAIMGVMGGTMGPMIALMMKVDHILWFMPLFTLLNVLIIWGLNFLVYEELVEKKEIIEKIKIERTTLNFWPFFLTCLIITALFVFIIIYGYASSFVAVS